MTTTQSNLVNGVDVSVLGNTVEAIRQDPDLGRSRFRIHNRWTGGSRNCSEASGFYGAKQEMTHKKTFEMYADEPPVLAGSDDAPNPVEHLLHSLASCLTTSLVAHAAVRGMHIEQIESDLEGDLDLRGFLGLSNEVPKGYSRIRARIRAKTDAEPQQLKRLAEFSPVYNTLRKACLIDLEIECRR